MKKLLLITVITVFIGTIAHSQEIRFGIKGGVNMSYLGGDSDGNFSLTFGTRIDAHFGGLVEIPLSEKFALQPEVLYSSEGSDYSILFGPSYELKLNYIRVPVLAKYYIIEGLSVELGPSFGFLISAKRDGYNYEEGEDDDELKKYKSFDTAIAIGASYRLPMGIFFSLRFNAGLMDINDRDGFDIKNQMNVFQISTGYSF